MSEHKSASRSALDHYDKLIADHPELVVGRTMRPIVVDRQLREEFATRTGASLGVVSENPYFFVIVDLVERKVGSVTSLFPYVRVVQRKQLQGAPGVAVLATIAAPQLGDLGDIVVTHQERHTTGRTELEIPRGFGEVGESSIEAALRELVEETGYVGVRPRLLGSIEPDSGIQDGCVTIVHVDAIDREASRNEHEEAIAHVSLFSPAKIANSINMGECRDSFTIVALALYAGLNI